MELLQLNAAVEFLKLCSSEEQGNKGNNFPNQGNTTLKEHHQDVSAHGRNEVGTAVGCTQIHEFHTKYSYMGIIFLIVSLGQLMLPYRVVCFRSWCFVFFSSASTWCWLIKGLLLTLASNRALT